jgi:hypothetical protein
MEKPAPRYDGYVTVSGFLWPDWAKGFPRLAETLREPPSNKIFAEGTCGWICRDISDSDISLRALQEFPPYVSNVIHIVARKAKVRLGAAAASVGISASSAFAAVSSARAMSV